MSRTFAVALGIGVLVLALNSVAKGDEAKREAGRKPASLSAPRLKDAVRDSARSGQVPAHRIAPKSKKARAPGSIRLQEQTPEK